MLPNGPFYQDTGGNWVFVVTPDGKSRDRAAMCGWAGAIPNSSKWWRAEAGREGRSSPAMRPIQKMDRVEFDQPENSNSRGTP